MAGSKTRIVIEGVDKLSPVVNKVERQMKGLRREGDETIKALASGLAKLHPAAAAAAVALGATIGVIGKALDAYRKQYEAEQRLAASIRSAAGGYDVMSGALTRLASELQSLTQLDDQKILAGMTKLVDIGVRDVPRAARAMADLSVVTGSVEAASEALGRAMVEPEKGLRALQRLGVQFTETERERIKALQESGRAAEAQAAILSKVEARFKGISAEMGALPTKQIERLANALGDALETLGRWASSLPFVGGAIRGIADALEAASGAMNRVAEEADASRLVSTALRQLRETGSVGEEVIRHLANVSDQTLGRVLASYDEANRQQRRLLQQQAEQLRIQIEQMSSEASMGWAAVNRQRLEADLAAIERQIASLQGASTRVLDQIRAYRERAAQAQREEEERQRREQALERAREIGARYDREVEALKNKYTVLTEIQRVQNDLARLEEIRLVTQNRARLQLIEEVKALAERRKAELELEASMTRLDRELAYVRRELSEVAQLQEEWTARLKETTDPSTLEALRRIGEQYNFLRASAMEKLRGELHELVEEREELANKEAAFWRLWYEVGDEQKGLLEEIGKKYGFIADAVRGAAEAQEDFLEKLKAGAVAARPYLDELKSIGGNIEAIFANAARAEVDRLEKGLQQVKGNLSQELEYRKGIGAELAQYEVDRMNQIQEEEERVAREKARIAREQALFTRSIKVAEATMEGAVKIIAALPNPVLVSLISASVATQIAAILSAPIPELAEGGIVKATAGGRVVRVAEGGEDEAIIPLSRLRLGQTIINIENAYGIPTEELARSLATSMNRVGSRRL